MAQDFEDIPHLGESYQKAHKAYGLSSALLMAWEIIGIEFDAAPVESLRITLKSPQAAPYILVVLVVYFAFRLSVEWYQADLRRRVMTPSRVDFWVAHLIGALSVALFGYQSLSQVQIANRITPEIAWSFFLGLFGGVAILQTPLMLLFWLSSKPRRSIQPGLLLASTILMFAGLYALFKTLAHHTLSPDGGLAGSAVSAMTSMVVFFLLLRRARANTPPRADA